MCSIYGFYGKNCDESLFEQMRQCAKDRGRDGGKFEHFNNNFNLGSPNTRWGENVARLGNWRATPTTELQAAPSQPYGGVIHNGTIANDVELGNTDGQVDSMILQHVLDRSSFPSFVKSLSKIKGSYALAISSHDGIYLAANYKPIYYFSRPDEGVYFSSMERHLKHLVPFGQAAARLQPYSAMNLQTQEIVPLPRDDGKKALVVCSAGLDSTTVAYKMKADGYDVGLLHFSYGAKAEQPELSRVHQIAKDLEVPLDVLTIDYSKFSGQSPLLTDRDIAEGIEGAEYAHEWVPARNLVLLAHAVAYAEANEYTYVALGNNLEESGAYPDNEEEFTNLLDKALDYAVHDGGQVRLLSPVGQLMKHEIVKLGTELGVPWEITWSCYTGSVEHCGSCAPCFMRKVAFERNGLVDPVML